MKTIFSKSVKWLGGSAAIGALIQILQLLIMSKNLSPYELGLGAAAMSFVFLIQVYAEMGVANAVIHFDNWDEEKTSTFFLLNLMLCTLLASLVYVFSTPIASFLGEIKLDLMLQFLALNIFFMPLGRVFQAFVQKDLFYEYIAKVEIISKTLNLCVFSFFIFIYESGAWAIIIASVFSTLFTLSLYLYKKTSRPNILLKFSFQSVQEEVRFCLFYLADTLTSSLNNQLDVIMIGKFLGMEKLGVYALFKQICVKPYQIINPLAVKVTLPLLSKVKNDTALFSQRNTEFLYFFIPLLTCVYILISIFSETILSLISRPEYIINEKIFSVLAVMCFIKALVSLNGINVIAKGMSKLNFIFNLSLSMILFLSLYFSLNYDLESVALVLVVTYMFALFINVCIVQNKIVAINSVQWLKIYLLPSIFISVTFLSIYFKVSGIYAVLQYSIIALVFFLSLKRVVFKVIE